ncbi:MAG TPA: hypothetical protein PK367_03075 [Candidatus Paceibacterota bacterium]|nr:hypothetical protein [Candidatus Paceibacterota bacterium]
MVLKRKDYIRLIEYGILYFKFAHAIFPENSDKKNKLKYLDIFTWGKHAASYNDLKLSSEEEVLGFSLLEHTAIYILVMQIDTAFESLFLNRFQHKNREIKNIAYVSRILRNSFAHNPFAPIWLIDRKMKNKKFLIRGILTLDTNNLSGKGVSRWDYGGPLALLKLAKRSIKLISSSDK